MAIRDTRATVRSGPVGGDRSPVEGLSVAGKALMDRAHALPWITAADSSLVRMLAESEDERIALRSFVLSDGGTWRERIALRSLDHQIGKLMDALGMTPRGRSRLKLPTGSTSSVLDELRSRRTHHPEP